MTIRAVVFDFDGVILETEEPEYLAWREIWSANGQELTRQEWAGCIGTNQALDTFHPFHELVRRSGLELVEAEVRAAKRERSTQLLADVPVLDGVLAWLNEAEAAGLRVAIASSSPRSWITEHLERLGLASQFPVIACFDDCGVTKPDPAAYLLACQLLEVAPAEALAVEDSLHGLTAAKRAGMACVVVPTAMTEHLDFEAADLVLPSLAERSLSEVLARLDALPGR